MESVFKVSVFDEIIEIVLVWLLVWTIGVTGKKVCDLETRFV